MDPGLAQIIGSVIGGVAVLGAALIAGSFTVRSAQQRSGNTRRSLSTARIKQANLLVGMLSLASLALIIGFFLALLGNSYNFGRGRSPVAAIFDSIDPALVSAIICPIFFAFGAALAYRGVLNKASGSTELNAERLILLMLLTWMVTSVLGYGLGFIGNTYNFGMGHYADAIIEDSLDSGIVGGILGAVAFVTGVRTYRSGVLS